MELSLKEYQELLGKVRGTQLIYLEDMSGDEGDDDYLDRHVADEGATEAFGEVLPPGSPKAALARGLRKPKLHDLVYSRVTADFLPGAAA